MTNLESSFSFPVSDDFFLGSHLRIYQPRQGYRAAIDPVFLAAAVPAKGEETVLDVGGGVGVASCCLLTRCQQVRLTGVELFSELAEIASVNHQRNGFGQRFKSVQGNIKDIPFLGSFDHVISNPPFGEKGQEALSPFLFKRHAHTESSLLLKDWLLFCLAHLKPKGFLSLIFRTSRLGHLLDILSDQLGNLQLIPLWPKEKVPSKRIILRGQKKIKSPLTLTPGLILHEESGVYTPEADRILRQGQALFLQETP